MTTKWMGLYDDDWWLEHMENEMEPGLRSDMDLMLKNSPKDLESLEKLGRLKKLIKESDEVSLPEDARYYDQLHEKIMKAVEGADELKEQISSQAKMSWTVFVLNALAARWGTPESWPR